MKAGQQIMEGRKEATAGLNAALQPVLRSLQGDPGALQLPEVALRCAQFFHSLSQYCLQHYRNDLKQRDLQKTKNIRKDQKDLKEKAARGRRKKDSERESPDPQKPEPPRKPLTAYIIYFQDKKHHFVERYPTLNLSELTKLIAKEWKELSDRERQVFLDRAADDRRRYDTQMSHFKALYGRLDRLFPEDEQQDEQQQPEVQEVEPQEAPEAEHDTPKPEEEPPQPQPQSPLEEEDEIEAEPEAEQEAERSSEEPEPNDSDNNESSESVRVLSNDRDE